MLQNAKEIETQIKNCEYDALKYSYFVRIMMQYGDVFCKGLCCLFSGEDELVEASQCFSQGKGKDQYRKTVYQFQTMAQDRNYF